MLILILRKWNKLFRNLCFYINDKKVYFKILKFWNCVGPNINAIRFFLFFAIFWISDLTWQNLKDFHSQHYSPDNARFYTYGNIELEEHLKALSEYLPKDSPNETSKTGFVIWFLFLEPLIEGKKQRSIILL